MTPRMIGASLFIFCLLLIDGAYGGQPETVCNDTGLSCLQTFQSRVDTTRMAAYSGTYSPGTQEDYTLLATRDETCRASNQDILDCMLTNLRDCATTVYINILPVNLAEVTTTAQLCSNLQSQACAARDRIFKLCYSDILPEIVSGPGSPVTLSRTCLAQYRDSMNCLLESYKECDSVIFQEGLQQFDQLKDEIFLNQWKRFDNGGDICGCAIKTSCQTNVDNRLFQYAFGGFSQTVTDEYDKVIGYAENLCSGETDVKCAYEIFAPTCIGSLYETRVYNFKRYYDFTQAVCAVIKSQGFNDSRACIIEQLTTELAFCKNVLPSSERNLNCPETEYYLSCFEMALDRKCGKFSSTIYEVFRDFYELPSHTLPCNGTPVHLLSFPVIVLFTSITVIIVSFSSSDSIL